MINFEDFEKINVKIGTVLEAKKVEDADKLIVMQVDFGEEKRQVVSGIAKSYDPEDLVDRQFPFVTNLEPRTIFGLESQAMIMGIDVKDKTVLMIPEKKVDSGSVVV